MNQKANNIMLYYEHVVILNVSDLLKIIKNNSLLKKRLYQSQWLDPAKHNKSPILKIKLPQKCRATRYVYNYSCMMNIDA